MAELNVTKKTVGQLLGDMQGRRFVIPDYQRPYAWDSEKCDVLWQDLISFFEEQKPHQNTDREYHLGTIVLCQSADGPKAKELEVIDGQQRLTSLLLLLRAFYKKLEGMDQRDPNVAGLMGQIAPCVWDVHPISKKVSDPTRVHLESRVATAKNNAALRQLLEKGDGRDDAEDLYSLNFRFFLEQCDQFARDMPMDWQPLCVAILNNCIILPIECETFDTALTIFYTLNDRGLPLSDSDIFKAQLYKFQPTNEAKHDLADAWKDLSDTVQSAGLSLDDLFRYYMYVVRARMGDTSKEIALRRFYSENKYARLNPSNADVMGDLAKLAARWRAIYTAEDADWIADDAWKWLHCLWEYPNDYWKYVVSAYFVLRLEPADVEIKMEFPRLLRILVAWLYSKFVVAPTVNAIKDPCFRMMNDIATGKPLAPPEGQLRDFREGLRGAWDSKIARGLILLHAYLHPGQEPMMKSWKFDVEHILPRKWQQANYLDWSREDAEEYLERFGNKVVLEKKLNIQAGNGYFGKKKEKYDKSAFVAAKALAGYPRNDWHKADIEKRDKQFVEDISAFVAATLEPTSTTPGGPPRGP